MDLDHVMFLQESFEATVSQVEPTAAAFSAVTVRDISVGRCLVQGGIIPPACFV